MKLAPVRHAGYDAWRGTQQVQIKGCRVLTGREASWRMSRVDLEKEWDLVMLVLLDEDYETTAIHEASRAALEAPLSELDKQARAQNRQPQGMPMTQFKALGTRKWPASPDADP